MHKFRYRHTRTPLNDGCDSDCFDSWCLFPCPKPIGASVCPPHPLWLAADRAGFDNVERSWIIFVCLQSTILTTECPAISLTVCALTIQLWRLLWPFILSRIRAEVMTHRSECDTDSVPPWCKGHCMRCGPVVAPGKKCLSLSSCVISVLEP